MDKIWRTKALLRYCTRGGLQRSSELIHVFITRLLFFLFSGDKIGRVTTLCRCYGNRLCAAPRFQVRWCSGQIVRELILNSYRSNSVFLFSRRKFRWGELDAPERTAQKRGECALGRLM
jgi:hypothetical protein